MWLRIFCLVVAATGSLSLSAQRYRAIDSASKALNLWNADQLAATFMKRYSGTQDRLRAAFTWVATHIDYDVHGFFGGNIYAAQFPATMSDSVMRDKVFAENVGKKVLKEKKGVCEGYAQLYKTLCLKMGIPCKVVTGYGKTSVEKSTKAYSSNHSWNLVQSGGKWYPVDATWAAGYTDFSKMRFYRDFNDHYFFTPPQLLLIDHYPENKEDALMKGVPDFGRFISTPYVYRDFWKFGPEKFSASSGVYSFADSSIVMQFKMHDSLKRLQVLQSPSTKQEAFFTAGQGVYYKGKNFVSIQRDGMIKLRYKPFKNADKKVTIYINGVAVMEFLIAG